MMCLCSANGASAHGIVFISPSLVQALTLENWADVDAHDLVGREESILDALLQGVRVDQVLRSR